MTLARLETSDTASPVTPLGPRLGAGMAGVTRLPGPHPAAHPGFRTGARGDVVPLALAQGTLALELDLYPALPRTPDLRLVNGGPPALRPWVARFTQAVVEVTSGDRGPQQLVRCTTRSVHRDLVERCATLNAVARGEQRRTRIRPQVRSVRVQQPSAMSAEVSVHVRHGEHSSAMAARIELVEGRWLCVALEFG